MKSMKGYIVLLLVFSSTFLTFGAPLDKTSILSKAKREYFFLGNHESSKRMMFIIGVAPMPSETGYIPNKKIFKKQELENFFSAKVESEFYFNVKIEANRPTSASVSFLSEDNNELAFLLIRYAKTSRLAQEFLFRSITGSSMYVHDYTAKEGDFGNFIVCPPSGSKNTPLSNLNAFYFVRGNIVVSLKRYDKAFDLEKLAKFIDEKLVNELQKHGIKILQEAPITTPEEVIATYMKKLNIQPKSRAKTKIQADTIKAFLAEKSVQHEYSFKSTKGRRFWRSPDFPNYSFNSLSKTKSGTFFELFYEDSPWDAQYALFYSAICRTGAITFEQFTNDYRVVKNADDSIILVGKDKSPLYLLHGNFFLKIYTGEKDKLAVTKRIDQKFLSDFSKETHP